MPLLCIQRGIVLFVSLIALVIISIAAIAISRSVSTANLIAGNISFKQSALSATDIGVQAAMNKFNSHASGVLSVDANTRNDSAADCYRATSFNNDDATPVDMRMDPRGIPNILLDSSKFDDSYGNCKSKHPNTKETIRYVIDRQCSVAGLADESTCTVYSRSAVGGSEGSSQTGSENIPLYRVSVRVDGAHNTTSYSQVIIHP